MKNIYKSIATVVFMLSAIQSYCQTFQVDDVIISDTTTGYIDPEFVQYKDSIFCAYALSNGNMWIGFIDNETGLFKSNYGKNRYLGGPWAPISIITNGPEFGLGENGPLAYFTKMKPNGISAIYEVKYPFTSNSAVEIKLDTNYSYAGVIGSFNLNYEKPYLWFYRGQLNDDKKSWEQGQVKNVWMNSETGEEFNIDKSPISTIRWAYNTPYITYSNTVNGVKQIFLLHTRTNKSIQATFDSDDKNDTWAFTSPEYNNSLLLMGNIDHNRIRIYREINGNWVAIDSLYLPKNNNPDTLLTSVEPLYGGNGINGVSYFTAQAYNPNNDYTSIWILGFGDKLQRRVDEGAISGILKERYDPETVIAKNEVFVYYTEQASTSRIRRCRTGIKYNDEKGYTLFPHIEYHKDTKANPNQLNLDIYKPNKQSGSLPVMVYIHGGYWNAGDKWFVGEKAKIFTDSGYVFVSINYRLSPDPIDTLKEEAIRFPIHPEDCARAIKWVYDSISIYNGDNTKISLIGHSDGAHLVLLLSTNEQFLEKVGLSLQKVKCTCSLDAGVFDVAEELNQAGSLVIRRAPLINAFGRDESLYDDASPQKHIERGKYLPQMSLVHQNNSDRLYSHNRFKDSLNKNGHFNHYYFNANPNDHGQINSMLENSDDYTGETIEVMRFFRDCLRNVATIKDLEEIIFRISPNPTSDYIEIKPEKSPYSHNSFSPFIKGDAKGKGISEIKIYNTFGECVIDLTPTQIPTGEGLRIGISHLPIGLYFIKFGNYSEKFVVVR